MYIRINWKTHKIDGDYTNGKSMAFLNIHKDDSAILLGNTSTRLHGFYSNKTWLIVIGN